MNKRQVKKWLFGKAEVKESIYERKPYMMVRLEYGRAEGVGFAKQNPTDEYSPQVGYYRARNRALDDLAEQLIRSMSPDDLRDRVNGWVAYGMPLDHERVLLKRAGAMQSFADHVSASFGQVV